MLLPCTRAAIQLRRRQHPGAFRSAMLQWALFLLFVLGFGVPAMDREFKTIDFLTFLDLDALSPETVARYLS